MKYSNIGNITSEEISTDVLIIGGGPAGLATALAVRKQMPLAKVIVLELTAYDKFRPGETVPGAIADYFKQLSLWDEFIQQDFVKAHGTMTSWGNEEMVDSPSLFSLGGNGWHLDRPQFDQWLVEVCLSREIEIFSNVTWRKGINKIEISRNGNHQLLSADLVVDATGSKAKYATLKGAESIVYDKLSAFYLTVPVDGSDQETYTQIISTEHGWWYTCRRPKDRVIAFFTDETVAKEYLNGSSKELKQELQEFLPKNIEAIEWKDLLASEAELTRHIARSQLQTQFTGDNWLSVGDAAITYDPLSGQGIYKAFHTATLASYAIHDFLVKGEKEALKKYAWLLNREFEGYNKIRTQFYQKERRWGDTGFWARRNPSITIAPNEHFIVNQTKHIKPLQWLTKQEQELILELCTTACKACIIVREVAKSTNDSTRLIYGLQEMLRSELLVKTKTVEHEEFA